MFSAVGLFVENLYCLLGFDHPEVGAECRGVYACVHLFVVNLYCLLGFNHPVTLRIFVLVNLQNCDPFLF